MLTLPYIVDVLEHRTIVSNHRNVRRCDSVRVDLFRPRLEQENDGEPSSDKRKSPEPPQTAVRTGITTR